MKKWFICLMVCILSASVIWFDALSQAITPQENQGNEDIGMLAFPTAEGFGADAKGGRGGKVVEVTSLKDYGPKEEPIKGTFRYALEKEKDPRIIVFRLGGIIEAKGDFKLRTPFVTIAGQSAPGDGILIRSGTLKIINTHDIIVRHLRIRVGDKWDGKDSKDNLTVENCKKVIVDHCSFSWSVDENMSFVDCKDITVQWSMLTEPLRNPGKHPKDTEHAYNSLMQVENASLHHNVFALAERRNPQSGRGKLDMVNNLIYGYFQQGTNASGDQYNIVNNYYKRPLSENNKKRIEITVDKEANEGIKIYARGNIGPNRPNADSGSDWDMVRNQSKFKLNDIKVNSRFSAPTITTQSAVDCYRLILNKNNGAGATLPQRDDVDLRIINLIEQNNGKIIDRPSDVGGYPNISSGQAPKDSDHDGMPDFWEKEHSLNPNNDDDRNNDQDRDGYTNLEEYLNQTDPREKN